VDGRSNSGWLRGSEVLCFPRLCNRDHSVERTCSISSPWPLVHMPVSLSHPLTMNHGYGSSGHLFHCSCSGTLGEFSVLGRTQPSANTCAGRMHIAKDRNEGSRSSPCIPRSSTSTHLPPCSLLFSNDIDLRKALRGTPRRRSRRCHRIPGRAREAYFDLPFGLHQCRPCATLQSPRRHRGQMLRS
jgi:hypothetical protein